MPHLWDMPSPKKKTAIRQPASTPGAAGKRRGRPPRSHEAPRLARPGHAAFATRLDQVRESVRESQTSFAQRCGVTTTNMGKYLRGELQPGFDVLVRIAEQTGVSLDWLLLGRGGTQARYDGQSRTNAELASDVARHVAREIAREQGQLCRCQLTESMIRVDGARLLADVVQKEAGALAEWADGESVRIEQTGRTIDLAQLLDRAAFFIESSAQGREHAAAQPDASQASVELNLRLAARLREETREFESHATAFRQAAEASWRVRSPRHYVGLSERGYLDFVKAVRMADPSQGPTLEAEIERRRGAKRSPKAAQPSV